MMNEAYAAAILKSVNNVLGMMAQIPVVPQAAEIKTNTMSRGDVTGLIKIKGQNIQGTASISFSKDLILELTKRMLRTEITEIDETAQDLAKEMANMLIGGAKSEMDDKGYYADMSIPYLSIGPEHEVIHGLGNPIMLIPMTTEYGNLWIELCFSG